ncbi:M12 family metallopeptidase [Sphingomonas tabacisoli]|uniref:M12 family metallopeptidase n=1 Tax=Sphingomonas tabacisoli TaxID=2249466 RepID=A0ABW4HZT2_9SPHN
MSNGVPNQDQWCFAWFAGEDGSDSQKKAALVKSSKWAPGSNIRIAFLDGTAQQKALVKQYAVEWITNLANLKFSWVNDPAQSDIRISFKYPGSWSVIGTTCKTVPKNQATMNFGWLTPTVTPAEARRVILHEFGHAVGLIHEHQNPKGGIHWNKQAVIDDLSGPPNNWDLPTIQHNMFDAYAASEINGTKLDKDSIMLYPIPISWTTDGFSAGLNGQLSATDKTFIKQQYK